MCRLLVMNGFGFKPVNVSHRKKLGLTDASAVQFSLAPGHQRLTYYVLECGHTRMTQ